MADEFTPEAIDALVKQARDQAAASAQMAEALSRVAAWMRSQPATPATPPVVVPPVGNAPVSLTIGSGNDTLVLKIAQDAYKENAKYNIWIDGNQIGETLEASALKSSGKFDVLIIKGNFGTAKHNVGIEFINDEWDGTPETDRNLYLLGASYNGKDVVGSAVDILSQGIEGFAFGETATPAEPMPTGDGSGKVNLLLRGQSNALYFADKGGFWQLVGELGNVEGLVEWGTDSSTCYAGTAFLDWVKNGQQAGLLKFLSKLTAEQRSRPTVTIWMHNEDEQKNSADKATWLKAVRADAVLVRKALGQDAKTTPYVFVPVRYNYGKNFAFLDGMNDLVNDFSFNATRCDAFNGTEMDGDGDVNGSHLGTNDAKVIAAALLLHLRPIVAALAGSAPSAPTTPAPTTPSLPTGGGNAGSGASGGGAAQAAAIVAKMGLGINQERFTVTEHGDAQKVHYYEHYKTYGIRNVRFFIPFGPEDWQIRDSTDEAIQPWLNGVKACIDSGMPVTWLDCCDVIGNWNVRRLDNNDNDTGENTAFVAKIEEHLERCGRMLAAMNLPVDRFIVGPINEYGGGNNAMWQPYRFKWNAILRKHLPGHTIVEGGCEWKYLGALFGEKPQWGEFVPWSDPNKIIDGHHYNGWDAGGIQWLCAESVKWAKANNVALIAGEFGFGEHAMNSNPYLWVDRANSWIDQAAPLSPYLWAVTNGNAWRVNEWGGNVMRTDNGLVDMPGAMRRWAKQVDAVKGFQK